jgi:hypothetical protein
MAATTAAVIGIASSVGGTYMSFREASKQSKAATTARLDAEKAMAEAKKRAEQNVFEALSLAKEPYERAREASLASGAQAIEAGRESERGIAATAGRVQMSQNEMQQNIADEQTAQIQGLNKLIASEDARLLDYLASVNMEEAAGAQKATAQADKFRAMNIAQGIQGIGNIASSASALLPMYYDSKATNQYEKLAKQATASGLSQEQFQNKLVELSAKPEFGALSGVGFSENSVDAKGNPIANMMTPVQFQDYMIQNPDLTKSLLKQDIFSTSAVSAPPYVERPSSTGSVLLPQPVVQTKTPGSYKPADLSMLPPELLKAYGIDPFSIQ